MAFLPQELRGAKEQTSTHLPADNVSPLVAQNRKVTVTLYPIAVCVPDDSLRCRTHYQLLLEFRIGIHDDALALGVVLQAVVRYHGTLLGESLDMVRLLREEGFGNEEREIGNLAYQKLMRNIRLIAKTL